VSYDLGDGKHAVVTLVSGSSSGYIAGAVALGQSLIDVGSELTRVVMVTPDVDQQSRKQMSRQWEVIEVDPIYCNHKHNLDPTQYDLSGDRYQAGLKRWSSTCTKFAAWKLTQFKRVIFMDADMLVVEPIDDALYGFSNASFLAAPVRSSSLIILKVLEELH
jgi:alpha-N-acetylglucosamine transferase